MGQPHAESSTFFRKQSGPAPTPNFHPSIDVQGPRGLEGPTHPSLGQRETSNTGCPPANVDVAFVPMSMDLGTPHSA